VATKASTLQSLSAASKSWRLGAVTLLSLSSGLPLGLVITAVPAWMAFAGVDIKTIGVLTLAQAPYAFKFLWSPLMDRFHPPGFGRKRGWVLLGQLALALLAFALASCAASPRVGVVGALTVLIAFASASQDIAIDAYTVEALRPEEQGLAVGARTAMYRLGMWIAGVIAISIAPLRIGGQEIGWGVTIALQGAIYLLLLPVTIFAPEPQVEAPPPRSLRDAVWEPFVSFFQKPRALQIAAFLLLYKLADNLAVSLVRPFLIQTGFDPIDVGVASGTVGLAFTMFGTFVGGLLTTGLGVGRALWLFGILQASAGAGYALVAEVGISRPLMYASTALEAGASGMGTGAFGVLLLRLTQKRFSATQYALFSSIFALGRTIAGPIAGALVDAVGWRDFFLITIACGAPGLLMLQRFVPWGARDIPAEVEAELAPAPCAGTPITRTGLLARGLLGLFAGFGAGLLVSAALSALKSARGGKPFDLLTPLASALHPSTPAQLLDLLGAAAFGVVLAMGVAAYLAARRGLVTAQPKSSAPSGDVT
jgi:PAT family beta-lactamase induction signal transducer AmpG